MPRRPSSPAAGTPSTQNSEVATLLAAARQQRRGGDLEAAQATLCRILELAPGHPEALEGLATIAMLRKQWDVAQRHVRQALQQRPDDPELLCSLAGALGGAEDFAGAVQVYRRALQRDPRSARAYEGLAWSLPMAGGDADLPDLVRKWLRVHPGNPVARHLAASLGQRPAPSRCETGYIQTFFDGFAESYDTLLTELQYRVPEMVAQRMQHWRGSPAEANLQILDVGCGTGFCGPILRPWAQTLVGVDLSARMLAKARARGCYDALHQADLCSHLEAHPGNWDVVVAADVLVYFGDLTGVVEATAAALRPGGHAIFSVERAEDGRDYALTSKGRYVHGEAALQRWLDDAGLQTAELSAVDLRLDRGTPEGGWFVVARRPVSP